MEPVTDHGKRGVRVATILNFRSDSPVSRSVFLLLFLPLFFVTVSAAAQERPAVETDAVVVAVDTVWSGAVELRRDILVKAGATLTIEPGTVVRVASGKTIWVDGQIRAEGSGSKRILFTTLAQESKARWHQLMVRKGRARLRFCDFEYADMAYHSHFTDVVIDNCIFRDNEIGIRFKGGPVVVRHSLFINNDYAVVPNFAEGEVVENVFSGNMVAILVRAQKGGGLEAHRNNFLSSSRFNLQMGELNMDEDIDVRDNWWGEEGPRATIFDDHQEPGIGKAVYAPAADKPFEL